MPSRFRLPIKISTSSSVHTCACLFPSVENSVKSVTEKGLRKEQQLFSKRKSPNCSKMLVINFSISWIYLESSCLYFPEMPRKMTKFVSNDLFEDLNFFWKGQVVVIKSTVVGGVFLLEVVHSSRWGVRLCQPKIKQFPFLYHFLKKLKMP